MKLTEIEFMDLLPRFMKKDYVVRYLADVMSDCTQDLGKGIELTKKWSRIDELSEENLDELARELDISWYMYDADLEIKRAIIKDSDLIHTIFGTREAVQRVIDMYFGESYVDPKDGKTKYRSEATVTEWWEPGFPLPKLSYYKDLDPNDNKLPNGNCYWFAITAPTMKMTPEELSRCKWVVGKVKSERSHAAFFIIVPIEINTVMADCKLTYMSCEKYICGERTCGVGERVGTVHEPGNGYHDVDEGRFITRLYGDCDPAEMTVTIEGDTTQTLSVTDGAYSVVLPTGTYTVTGIKENYTSDVKTVVVAGEQRCDLTLTPAVQYYTLSGVVGYSHNRGEEGIVTPADGAIIQSCGVEFENVDTGVRYHATANDRGEYSATLPQGEYRVTPQPGSGFVCGWWSYDIPGVSGLAFYKDCYPYEPDDIGDITDPRYIEAMTYFNTYPYEYDNETVTVTLNADKTQNLHSWITPCFNISLYDTRKDPETGLPIEPVITGPIILTGSSGTVVLQYSDGYCRGRVKADNYTLSTLSGLTSLPLYWECYDSQGENPEWTSAMDVDYSTSWRYHDAWDYTSVYTTMPEE